jgi:hypothetical protein
MLYELAQECLAGLGGGAPLLRRLGWRQALRRRAQTLAMVAGLALSAATITAAFGLQDSFTASTAADRPAPVGNVDETATGPFTPAQVSQALARLRRTPDVRAAAALSLSLAATLTAPRSAVTSTAYW